MTGMTGCPAPGFEIKNAHLNKRSFGGHELKWTSGVPLAPDEYYKGCTLLVKDPEAGIDEEGNPCPAYRKLAVGEYCYDAVMRCDSDQTAENYCRTLRANVIVSGVVFIDALVGLWPGADSCKLVSNHPAVLSLKMKVQSGLGDPSDEELADWGLDENAEPLPEETEAEAP